MSGGGVCLKDGEGRTEIILCVIWRRVQGP